MPELMDPMVAVVTHFARTSERDEILGHTLEAVGRMRSCGPLRVCVVSGTPLPAALAAKCDAHVFLAGNPGHVEGESRLVRRGLEVARWFGAGWVLKLASDCLLLDEDLPWRWLARARARGRRVVAAKWGDNRSLATLCFLGETDLLLERFPDLERRPQPHVPLERAFYEAMAPWPCDLLLLHDCELDLLGVRDGRGLQAQALEDVHRFLREGRLPAGAGLGWFAPHEDRWEGVDRSLCADFRPDPRAGRPPARALEPLRVRRIRHGDEACETPFRAASNEDGRRVADGRVAVGRVVVARQDFEQAVRAHAPSRVELLVEVGPDRAQVVHLGLALDDDVYPALAPGDHPRATGRVLDGAGLLVADLGEVSVTRHVSWVAIELDPGVRRLVLETETPDPRHARAVWLFENPLSFVGGAP